MAGPEEVAKAKVTIEGDISGLKDSVQEAVDETEKLGDASDRTSERGGSMFRRLGRGAEDVAAKLGKMTGIVSAITAATVALGAAWKAVNDYIRDGSELADEYLKTFDTVADAEGSLKAIGDRLVEVNAELERLEAKPFSIFGRSRKQIEEEIETLRKAQIQVSRQVRAQRERDAKDAAEAFKREAEAVAEDIIYSFLPDDLQIQRAANAQREAFIKAAKEAGVAIASEEVQNALRAIDQKRDIEIEAYREAQREKERIDAEAARKRIEQARREADAYADRLKERLDGIFGADSLSTLPGLEQALRDIDRNVGRLQ